MVRISLANPLLIYSFLWLTILSLAEARLTTNLLPLSASVLGLVLINILSFVGIYSFLKLLYKNKKVKIAFLLSQTELLYSYSIKLLRIWSIGTLLEIIYSRGVPLQWALMGQTDKNYTDFGIPSFHGVMNALFLFSITSMFLHYLVSHKKQPLKLMLVLLIWPVVMLGRGILLGAIMQLLGVFLQLRSVSHGVLIRLVVVAIVVIIGFGLLGDTRQQENPFAYLVDEEGPGRVLLNMPSGFLWSYVYATSPISNLSTNIDYIRPTYQPYYSISNLVPTFLRKTIFPDVELSLSFDLVDSNLNVSTFYMAFIADFGIAGAALAVALLQLICSLIFLAARRKSIWAIIAYSVLFQCIVFSVFYNLFTLLPYISQIILAIAFRLKYRVKEDSSPAISASGKLNVSKI